MVDKLYLSPQGLLEDSLRLGRLVHESGFRPTFIVAVWRGGAPIGIAVQEYLDYCGVRTDHIAIRTSSYSGIDGRAREVAVHGLNYLVKNVRAEDSLLIVDDVFDTGRTIEAIISHLRTRARLNTPHDIRIAVPYYKPTRNETGTPPDYYLHETEHWLKYPHSLEGLTIEEIRQHRPAIYEIIGHLLEPSRDPADGAAARRAGH
ncbi:MAG: hypoxanthine phosphoribosyltransferase [bacterium]|nr:hypoxanthine phosphoribosyltransferase [bacterium]